MITSIIEKKKRILALTIIGMLLISFGVVSAQPNQTLNYQGLLTHADGEIMEDQAMSITFQLYASESAGLGLWSETQRVDIVNGVFNVELGAVNPLDVDFNQPLWLGLTLDDQSELSPRIKLTASTHSLTALSVAPGAAVQSINGLKDDVELVAGDNVTLSQEGSQITIAAQAGSAGDGSNISSVRAGEGLVGGGSRGEVQLSIGEGAVSSDLLSNNSVNSAKIMDGSIRKDDLGEGSVTAEKVAANQIVKSINGLRDEVEIVEGENIDIRRNGNRIRISAENTDGSPISIRESQTIEVDKENHDYRLDVKFPAKWAAASNEPSITVTNTMGPVMGAIGEGKQVVICPRREALSALNTTSGYQVFLAGQNEAVAAVSGSRLVASLGGNDGAVYGRSTTNGAPASKFDGSIEINGTASLTRRGPGAVLMNFNIDRTWQLRQFGSGAGTALEFASISGGGNKDFLISTDGQVGIGTTDPRAKLHVNGNVMASSFNQASSRRWKKNISSIDNALNIVNQLRGVSYRWKEDDRADIGLIAEEVGAIVPEIVAFEENGNDARSIDYGRLAPILIEGIKELHLIVQQQQMQIDQLKAK